MIRSHRPGVGEHSDVSRVFEALSDDRRRRVLTCLARHSPLDLDELADRVATGESGQVGDADPADAHRSLRIDLYHCHVPRLAAVGLVDYDREADVVDVTDDGLTVGTWLAESVRDVPALDAA